MKREAKFTSLYDLHITFTFLCYFSTMKAGFDCMGQVNCFVRKGTGTILSPLPPLNLGKCLAEGEVTVKIASIIKIDIWFESRTPPFVKQLTGQFLILSLPWLGSIFLDAK